VTRLKWKLVLDRLEIVLILTQDRCTVCAERTIGSEIILDDPMDLLSDIGHLESCFNPFGDCVIVSAKLGTWFAPNIAHKLFWTHLSVTRLKWMLVLVYLEILLILTQDRCTVWAECTLGSELILDAPDGSPR
jgi:hypothetical protein